MDAWVLTDQSRAYASAIIVINYDNVGRWAGQMKVPYKTFAELSQKPEVYGLVKKDIARINQDLPRGARVKKFVNLHKEFDPDEGELTRTRNLRRIFLEERYREIIDAIYGDRAEVSLESQATLSIHSVEGAA
jgi:long-chain acyl-CoA synthetase